MNAGDARVHNLVEEIPNIAIGVLQARDAVLLALVNLSF